MQSFYTFFQNYKVNVCEHLALLKAKNKWSVISMSKKNIEAKHHIICTKKSLDNIKTLTEDLKGNLEVTYFKVILGISKVIFTPIYYYEFNSLLKDYEII